MRRLPLVALPAMQCDDGCGACCGPVPVTKSEAYEILGYMRRHGVTPKADHGPLQCALFDGQRCTVHPVRPLLCRVFGHTPRLECSRGHNVNVGDEFIAQAVRDNGRAVGMLNDLVGAA